MGRLEHLKRMALGRSAYSNYEDDVPVRLNHQQDGSTSQQYNAKGQPINPAKEQLSTSLRQAQNEVLALVGILERKQSFPMRVQAKEITAHKHDQQNHEHAPNHQEFDYANMLSRQADITSMILTWYPHTLLLRCLAGVYAKDLSLASIIGKDMSTLASGSLSQKLNVVLPGFLPRIAYNELSTFTTLSIDYLLGLAVDSQSKHRRSSTHIARVALKAAVQWCLLPLLQLAISAQLDPSKQVLSDADQVLILSSRLRQFISTDFTSFNTWSIVAMLSLTGAFCSGSMNVLVQQRAAPPAISVAQFGQGFSAVISHARAQSAASLFPQVVGLLGNARSSLLAWLDRDISNQISTLSSHDHMDADAAHPAANPPSSENDRSVTDPSVSFQSTLQTHVALERFMSLTDAILLQIIQLPAECLLLQTTSGRLTGPVPISIHDALLGANDNNGIMRNGVCLNTTSRIGLSLSLVFLTEMAAYGTTRWIVDRLYFDLS